MLTARFSTTPTFADGIAGRKIVFSGSKVIPVRVKLYYFAVSLNKLKQSIIAKGHYYNLAYFFY